MKLSRYEQETVINYNAGGPTATVYTRDKAVMRKFDSPVGDFPETYKLVEQDEVSKTYSFPKLYISYRKPMAISFEQKELAIKHIKMINIKKIYVCAENDDRIIERNAKLTR